MSASSNWLCSSFAMTRASCISVCVSKAIDRMEVSCKISSRALCNSSSSVSERVSRIRCNSVSSEACPCKSAKSRMHVSNSSMNSAHFLVSEFTSSRNSASRCSVACCSFCSNSLHDSSVESSRCFNSTRSLASSMSPSSRSAASSASKDASRASHSSTKACCLRLTSASLAVVDSACTSASLRQSCNSALSWRCLERECVIVSSSVSLSHRLRCVKVWHSSSRC
mmetsp:Transcript_25181/g.43996  ORF Transcript_25181/g.43996 Transcript_25181/m.43996 type:complete len:225 (-) Transcript_25181:912-1586(-)